MIKSQSPSLAHHAQLLKKRGKRFIEEKKRGCWKQMLDGTPL
jgi:hypothetical protein